MITGGYHTARVPRKRWYQKLSKRFPDYIERALASEDPRRRALAWIMLDELLPGPVTQRRFAKMVGWGDDESGQSKLQQYLAGGKGISDRAIREMAAALKRPESDFLKVCHPLGFDLRGPDGAIEPGDDAWEGLWSFYRTLRPKHYEDLAALRARKPYWFPEDSTEGE